MIEHRIIAAKGYAYIVIKQAPDLATFLRAATLFINDPEYTAELHRLCDFSQADLSNISQKDFDYFLKFALEKISMAPTAKVALVAPSPEKAGIFKAFADMVGTGNFRLFYDPEEAVLWINEKSV